MRKNARRMAIAFAGILSLVLMACPSSERNGKKATQTSAAIPATSGKEDKDPDRHLVLAKIGKQKITVGMLADEINRQNPYVRMRFSSVEQKKSFLKNMVRFEVLAEEAKKRHLDQDPAVIRRYRRAMIEQMMVHLRNTLVKLEDITDADVEAYYEKNIKQYKQPARVRVSQIVVKSKKEALAIIQKAKKKPSDLNYFVELVRDHSIDAVTKAKRGELGFLTKDSKDVPEVVVKAAFAIPGMWQLGGPVKTNKGWVVLMKTGHMEPVDRPLEMERGRIKNRIFNQRRLKAVENFTKNLVDKAKVEVLEQNLSKVKVNLEARPPSPRNRTNR